MFNVINKLIINATSFLYHLKYKNINFIFSAPKNVEINKLWEKVKPHNGFSLVRDMAYWDHRYIQRPNVEYKLFSCYLSEELIGLVALRVIEDELLNKTICIAEWMNTKEVSEDYLIFKVVEYFKDDNVNFYNLWTNSYTGKKILKLFFKKRNRVPIIFSYNKSNEFLKDSKEIKFYMGTSDAI